MMEKVFVFDLDGTLTQSKGPIDQQMGMLLRKLLEHHEVCVVSGGRRKQFQDQLIDHLPAGSRLWKLHCFHTDKGLAIQEIQKRLKCGIQDMVFFGDRIHPGGNGYAVYQAGVECIPVDNHVDCAWKVKQYIKIQFI